MPKIMPLIWAGRAVAVTLVALAFTDTIPSGSFLFGSSLPWPPALSSLAAAGESAGDLHFLPPML